MATATKPTPKKLLVHLGYDQNAVDPRTVKVRWTDPRPSNWLITTQAWKWDDGKCDALVVVADVPGNRNAGGYTILRTGDKVRVFEGSLYDAMKQAGIDPTAYITLGREDFVAWTLLKPATRRALQRAAALGQAPLTQEQVAEIGTDCMTIPTRTKVAILGVGMKDGQLGAWTEA